MGYQTDDTTGRQIEELLKNSNVFAEDRGHTSYPEARTNQDSFWRLSINMTPGTTAGLSQKPGRHNRPMAANRNASTARALANGWQFLPLPGEASAAEETTAATGSEDRKPPEEVDVPLLGRLVVRESGVFPPLRF